MDKKSEISSPSSPRDKAGEENRDEKAEDSDGSCTQEIIKIDQVIKAKLPPKEQHNNKHEQLQDSDISLSSLLAISKSSYPIAIASQAKDLFGHGHDGRHDDETNGVPAKIPKKNPEAKSKAANNNNNNNDDDELSSINTIVSSTHVPNLIQQQNSLPGNILILDENLFQCSICKKNFTLKANCKEHLLRHLGDEAKMFSCKSCNKKFINSRDLKQHMVIHTNQKPFYCPMCSKSFSRKRVLKIHERTHEHGGSGAMIKNDSI